MINFFKKPIDKMEKTCYYLSRNGKQFPRREGTEANMDRCGRYSDRINEQGSAKRPTAVKAQNPRELADTPYRDYFAEALAFVLSMISHYAFRFAASVAGFVTVLLFTVGIAGGIELEVLPLACGVPLGVMLLCILTLLNKARK